jgi:hypothetical protein
MSQSKTDIYVYAHWQEMKEPKLIGVLSTTKGKTFSFEYDRNWLKKEQIPLDQTSIIWWSTIPNKKTSVFF